MKGPTHSPEKKKKKGVPMTRRLVLAFCASLGLLGLVTPAQADKPTPAGGAAPADAKKTAKAPASFSSKPAPGTRARCAVTGEEFTVDEKTKFTTHQGRVYAFCCPDCQPTFEKDPSKYAEKK
jgi:YHS domain-containing protein